MAISLPDQSGKTYIVTGANSGLGFETSRALAEAGAHVVMAVRDTGSGTKAAERIGGSTEIRTLDLADLSSVRSFAEAYDAPLHGLINNAGIMMVSEGRTVDGFERQFGTNHLGHFALTNLLLPRLDARGRVVTVSSDLHRGRQLDFDNLDLAGSYSPTRAYQQSKLANMLFTAELQRKLEAAGSQITANAAHPGYAATNLQSHHANPLAARLMGVANRIVARSAEAGAQPTLLAATGDLPGNSFIGPSGFRQFLGAPGPVVRSEQAQDLAAAARLWQVSEDLTGVRWPLS